jgi:hypothetical protein
MVTQATEGLLQLGVDERYSMLVKLESTPPGGDLVITTTFADLGVFSLTDRTLILTSTGVDTVWIGSADGSSVTLPIAIESPSSPGGAEQLELDLTFRK